MQSKCSHAQAARSTRDTPPAKQFTQLKLKESAAKGLTRKRDVSRNPTAASIQHPVPTMPIVGFFDAPLRPHKSVGKCTTRALWLIPDYLRRVPLLACPAMRMMADTQPPFGDRPTKPYSIMRNTAPRHVTQQPKSSPAAHFADAGASPRPPYARSRSSNEMNATKMAAAA